MLFHILALLSVFGLARAAAVTKRQDGSLTDLSSAESESFRPYTLYAAAAYCQPSLTSSWSCGGVYLGAFGISELMFFTTAPEKCTSNPTFQPYASGGDGSAVQFCS
jgi:hypothetical protein